MRRQLALVPLAVVAVAGLLAILSTEVDRSVAADPGGGRGATTTAGVDSLNVPAGVNLRRTVTVSVVQQTKDAVVNISTRKIIEQPVQVRDLFQTYDTGQVVRRAANSLGSGFLIHRDGYVVTNNHVVDRARQINVELADGQTLPAEVVGADREADLAVLRVHAKTPLPTLVMGDSSDLMIGEPVIAVGNPLGLSHSVSTGIVSALHREINPAGEPGDGEPGNVRGESAGLRDLIQTDAAINPGNSGGPLLNAYGQVIGINTAIRGDAQNIGFAIPIDRLRDLIPELMNPSQTAKVDVPLHLAERRTTAEPATVTTRLVTTGDRSVEIAAVNGHRPADIVDAYAMLLGLHPGQPFTVSFADGRQQKLTATATALPDAIVQVRQRFGLTIEPITPMLAGRYRLAQDDGILVTGVDRNGAAAQAGLRPGDVWDRLGRYHLSTLDDVGALMTRLPQKGEVPIRVIRGPQAGYVTLKF